MSIASFIKEKHTKLLPGDDPEVPVNDSLLLSDCKSKGFEIREGVFLFKDDSLIDTINSHITCYKSITDYLLKSK